MHKNISYIASTDSTELKEPYQSIPLRNLLSLLFSYVYEHSRKIMKSERKVEDSFKLLEKFTSVDKDLVWTQSNCDPFAAILALLEKEENLPECPSSCRCGQRPYPHEIATTSKSSSHHFEPNTFFDVRVRYGHLIMLVFREIAHGLTSANESESLEKSMETPVVSLKNSALLSSAFQFFILTCVSPYLDQGVGIPLQLRSHVIRSWEKCASDQEFKRAQLILAGECITDLLDCDDNVRTTLLRKYCSDIVCVFEQLLLLDDTSLSKIYERIMGLLDPQLLVCTYLGLLKPRGGVSPPKNFVLSIGSRLTNILMAKGGLGVTLSSYEEINGEHFWQNTPFLTSLAKQFALPPKKSKKMSYYRNMTAQFIELITTAKFSRTKVAALFSMFVEEMRSREPVAADIFVDDTLFKVWEALPSLPHPAWTNDHATSLILLRLWSDGNASARNLKANQRFLPCVAVLLSLLSVSDVDKKTSLTSVVDDIFAICRSALKDVENLSDLLLSFISDPSPSFEITQQRSLVQEVDMKISLYGNVALSRAVLNREQLLARRIDSCLSFVKSLDKPLSSHLLVEIACKCVQRWSIDVNVPRFIRDLSATSVLPQSSWHFIAGVFFEQIQDSDIDCADRNTVISLLRLSQEIIRSTMQYLQERSKKLSSLDIIAVESEEDRQLHVTELQNAKMAVGLAGAVVVTASLDEEISSELSKTCAVMSSFSKLVNDLKCSDEDVLVIGSDAQKLASLFEKEQSSTEVTHSVTSKKESAVDVVESMRERITQDSPVDRGGALLDVGRLIRSRSPTILLQLEEWLFEAMKGALFDHDSYVYLAAINALAEASCYSSKYLREMISLFKDFQVPSTSSAPQADPIQESDAVNGENPVSVEVVVRSRLCEAIGKVFKELGEMGPVWMDECAGDFLACFSEDDEILRASSVQSLAELVLACRGKNIEKYLNEILLLVENALTSESSALVRRAAVNLLRQIIKSCDTMIFEVIGSRLRDLHRQILHLWRFDPDHVDWLMNKVDVAAIAATVQEFYQTNNAERRKQLDEDLCQFKDRFSCDDTVAACILLMGGRYPANVQYFGAISLYETIRQRYEECVANIALMEVLKSFLIENLTSSAHVQLQSITNKLSSALAILSLYCIPDVWPDPVATLTNIWAAQPELLLRVLAEIAAEFSNIKMPLTQRSKLKTELHRTSEDIIRIISTVMGAEDASPSTRQAAVECVEQWIKLPGVGLQQWASVLSVVFGAVAEDSAALTNLLNILAANDELASTDQLVNDLCHYITTTVAQKLSTDIADDVDSDEFVSLVSAICTVAVTAIPTLLKNAKKNGPELLCELCSLLASISSCDGFYAVDELISDMPAPFFTTLREHIGSIASCSRQDNTLNVATAVSSYYAEVCRTAVAKMSFPPDECFKQYDKVQREQFCRYRLARSEISIDAYFMTGRETLQFLNQELEQSIAKRDLCRIEAIMYLWENVADYLSEADYAEICFNLELCTRLSGIGEGVDADRLANTIMRHLHALSHLIQEHDNAAEFEGHVVCLVLPFVARKGVSIEALRTLDKFVSERSNGIKRVDNEISQCCYSFFMDETNNQDLRLQALKCIGYVLSTKSQSDVMNILNNVVSHHLQGMENGDAVLSQGKIEEIKFQISIFMCLFSSLNSKETARSDESPIVLIFRQVFPVFRNFLELNELPTAVGDKVCDAVRSAVSNFPAEHLPEMLPMVSELLSRALFTNPSAGCTLAKTVVLVFGHNASTTPPLCKCIREWLESFAQTLPSQSVEEWLSLIYQIMKKNYKMLRANGEESLSSISSAILIAGQTLADSREPCVVRLASQVLAIIATQCTSYGDEAPRLLLARHGPELVKTIFIRIQTELIRATVESLAEVLYFFAKEFSAETRTVLNGMENGDSPLVAAMFREIGNLRNFKQMTLRLNMASLKDMRS
ncbi:unnamed protein product [Cylicocyclus nassatus]|uniref:HEAT repeat protein n=1 Tax=Cylicocyclus nassatus TaxID=53992 RepID=A0AA36M4Q5_CYLNA|nr:unnamed protein product [Cylicocyclus nassatus]